MTRGPGLLWELLREKSFLLTKTVKLKLGGCTSGLDRPALRLAEKEGGGRERGVRCGFPLARASEPRGFHALRQTLGDVSGR